VKTFDGIPLWESFQEIINSHNRVAADSTQAIIDNPEVKLDLWYYCKQCNRAWMIIDNEVKFIPFNAFRKDRYEPKPCGVENCKL